MLHMMDLRWKFDFTKTSVSLNVLVEIKKIATELYRKKRNVAKADK